MSFVGLYNGIDKELVYGCLCYRDIQTVWHQSHLRSLIKLMRAFNHSTDVGLEEGSWLLSFGMEQQTIRYSKCRIHGNAQLS